MTPPDPSLPPLFSGYLASKAATSSESSSAAKLVIGGAIAVLSGILVPIGSLVLCLAGGLLVLGARRIRWAAPQYGKTIVVAAAIPLLVDIVRYGRPAAWWLLCGLGVGLAAHFARPPEISIRRVLLTSVRNAVLAAALGLTAVLAMQLALHYISDHHEVLARDWTLRIGDARAWLEEVVLLGPKQLAVLLALLIAMVTIAPSLNAVRNYRRVARVASHGLLALIVGTSFMFSGNSYSRSAEWVARISLAREHLGAIDKSHEEVVKTAAVERSIVELDPHQRKILISLGQAIELHPLRAELRQRLATELILSSTRQELDRHAEAARKQLEQSKPSAEHRSSQAVIESARQRIQRGESVSRQELAALKIERTRAAARRIEARAAVRQFLADTLCPPLIGELVQDMIDATPVRGRIPPTNRAAVASAMGYALAEPPRVSFDHVLSHEVDELVPLSVQTAAIVRRTGFRIEDERQAANTAAEAKRLRSHSGRSFGGSVEGGKRSRGGTLRSRGGSRFGVRGGGPLLTA